MRREGKGTHGSSKTFSKPLTTDVFLTHPLCYLSPNQCYFLKTHPKFQIYRGISLRPMEMCVRSWKHCNEAQNNYGSIGDKFRKKCLPVSWPPHCCTTSQNSQFYFYLPFLPSCLGIMCSEGVTLTQLLSRQRKLELEVPVFWGCAEMDSTWWQKSIPRKF